MSEYEIIRLRERPGIKDALARWFHDRWGVPLEAYRESMDECLSGSSAVPQWYCVSDCGGIVGGLGVIENDFHSRKDLTPNVCAVYVEGEYRNRGIAGRMLEFVCEDMKSLGVDTLYLVTDHEELYERYGWEFLCTAQGDGESHTTRVYVHRAD